MALVAEHRGLSNNQIKLIAMVAMLLDHTGLILFPSVRILRIIGRLAFPLFAYMIAEGATHTRHRTRYLLSMAGLGMACQAVCIVVTGSWHLNILITFTLSLVLIFCIHAFGQRKSARTIIGLIAGVSGVLFLTVIAPWLFASKGYHVDYGLPGVLFPVVIFFAPDRCGHCPGRSQTTAGFWPGKLICVTALLLIMGLRAGGIQWYGLLALPLLALYNGTRGQWRLKYLFYIFYPAHLAVLYAIAWLWRK